MPHNMKSELEVSEHASHDSPSRNQLESAVSTSSNWSLRAQAGESDDEEPTSELDSVRDGVDTLNGLETTSIVSRRTSATAMDSHGVSFQQADVEYGETIILANNRPTPVLAQVQGVDSPRSSTEHTHQPTIEPNTSSETTDSGLAVDSILSAHTTFTPQTPTHTPIQPTATETPNSEIPPLDLSAATANLHQIEQAPRGDLYLVPGDDSYVVPGDREGDPVRAAYRLGTLVSLARTTANASQRIHLALPNPRALATVEVVMTVPYELGRDPVSVEVALPPRNSPFVRERHYMVELEVMQDADYDDDDELAAPHLPLDDLATVEDSKAEMFVKQLPRLDLVDMPELQDLPCSICQESYALGSHSVSEQGGAEHETPVRLPCSHVFGERCLTSWLHTYRGSSTAFNTQCPLCRQELAVDQAGVMFRLPEGVRREPDGVSETEYARFSYEIIALGNRRFGPGWLEVLRDPELVAELTLRDLVSQDPGDGSVRSLFEMLQSKGAFRSPYITDQDLAYRNRCDMEVYETLKAEGAHWTTRWGWMKDGRRMFGPRLNEEERKDYIRGHIRTNPACSMFRASDDVLRRLESLGAYAYKHNLDY